MPARADRASVIAIITDSYRPWQGVPSTSVATLASNLAAQTTKHLLSPAKYYDTF